jgi:hypothetical protein
LCSISRSPFFETLTVLLETKHIADFRKSLNRFLTPSGTDAGGYNSWKLLGVDGEMAGNNSHGACPSFARYDRQQKHWSLASQDAAPLCFSGFSSRSNLNTRP